MDITKLEIVDFNNQEKFRNSVLNRIANQGRLAFRMKRRLKDCPPFRDEGMESAWCIGWNQEKHEEEWRQKQNRASELFIRASEVIKTNWPWLRDEEIKQMSRILADAYMKR